MFWLCSGRYYKWGTSETLAPFGGIHLSKIRIEWNKFYKQFDASGTVPTKQQLLDKATEIDQMFGDLFNPPLK